MDSGSFFSLEKRGAEVALVWMEDPDDAVNTLKRELVADFDRLLEELEADAGLRVVVFASAKPDSFIAGANLDMLQGVATAAEARELSQLAQNLNNRLAGLRPRSVAAIHGACLGGGLELVLALDLRVASSDPGTRIGLPEVRLGLLPGGGGTQRLPRLVGAERALELLLTGRELRAERARRAGIVDEVVAKDILIDAAIALARKAQPPRSRRQGLAGVKKSLRALLVSRNPVGRRILYERARARVVRTTRGNYPAPLRILEVVRSGLERGFESGLEMEAEAFGELVVSREAQQLIGLFLATRVLKKDLDAQFAQVEPRPIGKLGVVGGGLMGAGIGYVTIAKAGVPVRMKDKDDAGLGHGLAYVHRLLDERVSRRSLSPLQRTQTLARISGTVEYAGFANCDLVVEAVYEDLSLKQRILREIETITADRCIFASNTSAIPIGDIADASRRPETVLGMHYFSPVEKMPLLEIIATKHTAPWAVASCVGIGRKQGKTVIVVGDGPGFYTSRVLAPYINEAVHLLMEGVAIDRIDDALQEFGFPIGPLALLDEVGVDVGQKVADTLGTAFGERLRVPPGMDRLLQDRRLGKKNRRGFYRYADRGAKKRVVDDAVYALLEVAADNPMPVQEIAERCALQMVNEAVRCLGEGVLRCPRDGDLGAVFGLGFPPFRGGPFRYLDARGVGEVKAKLEALAADHGERFAPAPLLGDGERFYPR